MQFSFITTLDAGVPHLTGVTDLEVFERGGVTTLYSGSEANGGLSVFTLSAGMAASFTDQIGASVNRGTYGLSGLRAVEVDGQGIVVPAGRHDDRLAFHRLDAAGEITGIQILGADPALIGNLQHVEVLEVDGRTFMVGSQWGQEGFRSYRIRDDLSLEHKRHFADSETTHISDVAAIADLEVDGRSYFFTASAGENGVTSWWMGRWGNIKERDSIDPSDGLWVSTPSALATAVVDGTGYVVLGAAGSDSLTTLRVDQWGGMFVRDHVLDDLGTRFADVSALESFSVGGRSFLLAAGSDDGMSLFEIAAGGKLLHLSSVADALDTRLSDVSAIETAVFGTEVQVFVTSGDEAGLSQFTLDFSALGQLETGWTGADALTGGAGDDMLAGYDGDDVLHGQAGDDVLIDGPGADEMTGGPGADRFVFLADRRLDKVMDFTPGEDRLDLSDFPMLYGMNQLDFTQKLYGVLVTFGDERVRLEGAEGQLLVADLGAEDFIF